MKKILLAALALLAVGCVSSKTNSSDPPKAGATLTNDQRSPAPGTPGWNPSWYAATDVYVDHAGTAPGDTCSDTVNNCTSATTACCTIGEIYRRYGSHYVSLMSNQVTTLHVLTGQSLAQGESDPYGTIGFTAPGNSAFVMTGTLVANGTTFLAGTVTQISRANPGNDFEVQLGAASDAGITFAVGQLLYDSAPTGGSYCWIDSVSGNLITCSSPRKGTNLTTPTLGYTDSADGASWTIGDTLQLYTVPTIYATSAQMASGPVSNTSSKGYVWIQTLNFGDLYSGVPGVSIMSFTMSGYSVLSLIRADGYASINGVTNTIVFTEPQVASSYLNGGVFASHGTTFYGGSINTSGTINDNMYDGVTIRGDMILHGKQVFLGYTQIYNAHVPSGATPGIAVQGPELVLRNGTAAVLWGAGSIDVYEGAVIVNDTGGSWATNVAVGSLFLNVGGAGAGCGFSSATALWNCGPDGGGISLTSSNIDSNGGLQDPTTGAKFAN